MQITLLGHSGIGKTTLSALLTNGGWYHYSGDYRIATRYLDEAVNLWLENVAAQIPTLKKLLEEDALSIKGKVEIEKLAVLSAYIGKLGREGFSLNEFLTRQKAFTEAEKQAMYDIPLFIHRAKTRFKKEKFINDAGGSLGEYGDDLELMEFLAQRTIFVYLHAEEDLQQELENRAARYPKPICYQPQFLQTMIESYKQVSGIKNPDDFPSDEFLRFVMPYFFRHRRDNYLKIAKKYGVILKVKEVWQCREAADFENLLKKELKAQRGV